MNVKKLKDLCKGLPGSMEVLKGDPYHKEVYTIGNKMFAYFYTNMPDKWRFSLRVTPERFIELTDQPGITPAKYMNRHHWITILKVNTVDEDYLTELVQWSYEKALNSLPKKLQQQLVN